MCSISSGLQCHAEAELPARSTMSNLSLINTIRILALRPVRGIRSLTLSSRTLGTVYKSTYPTRNPGAVPAVRPTVTQGTNARRMARPLVSVSKQIRASSPLISSDGNVTDGCGVFDLTPISIPAAGDLSCKDGDGLTSGRDSIAENIKEFCGEAIPGKNLDPLARGSTPEDSMLYRKDRDTVATEWNDNGFTCPHNHESVDLPKDYCEVLLGSEALVLMVRPYITIANISRRNQG